MSVVFPKAGGYAGNPNYIGSFTWATKPAAAVVNGAVCYVTNVGAGGGSYWYSDGVIWRPHGRVVLQSRTASDAISSTSEVKTQSQLIPAGMLQAGLILRVTSNIVKSAGTYTGTFRLHFGAANTVSDVQIGSDLVHPATTNRQLVTQFDLCRISATSVRVLTSGTPYPYAPGVYTAPDITLSASANMDTTDMYLTQGLLISNAAESLTNKNFMVEVL